MTAEWTCRFLHLFQLTKSIGKLASIADHIAAAFAPITVHAFFTVALPAFVARVYPLHVLIALLADGTAAPIASELLDAPAKPTIAQLQG